MANAKKIRTATSGGMERPVVTTGPVDPVKARIARKAIGAGGFNFGEGGRSREAGMLIDTSQVAAPYSTGYKLEAYRTSYAYGLSDRTGAYDIPTYFVQMNEQNGGMLYWPVTLHERLSWFRYFTRCFTNPNVRITRADGTESPLYELMVGDKLLNVKGETTFVVEMTSQHYEGTVYKIEAEGLTRADLEVNEEHPFLIIRKNNVMRHHNRVMGKDGIQHRKTAVEIDYSPVWVAAKDIEEGDFFVVPKTEGSNNDISVEKARLLGYYLAEGNVNFGRTGKPQAITWSLGTHEPDIIREIEELCIAVTGKKPSKYSYDSQPSGTALRLWDSDFAKWIVKSAGCGSHNKKLSDKMFHLSDKLSRHMIACWLNGDGCRDSEFAVGQMVGTTVSEKLAHQLYLISVRIGTTPAYYVAPTYAYGSPRGGIIGTSFIIHYPAASAEELVIQTKWKTHHDKEYRYRRHNYNGNMLLPIRKITTRDFSGLVYNVRTDGKEYEDRTFLVYGVASHNTDAYIGRAMELLSDLPMSKLTLNMPKPFGKLSKKLASEINDFFTYQLEVLNAFELCQTILWELPICGNVYLYHEWNSKKKMWDRAVILPPEETYIFHYPFSDSARVEYRPQRLISLIKAQGGEVSSEVPKGDYDRSAMNEKIVEGVPKEMRDMVMKEGCIVMDTDPMTGSFVHHIARRRHPYHDLGASILERVLVPMLQKEHYRYTQLSLASRNMTPKNLITAPGLMPEELDELRTQVDLSYMDPEYSVITNYEVTWEQIGVQERFLDFSREYEQIENQVFAALGVTRELLTGEGAFSGTKITVEILNTMFMLSREVLKNYIEKQLFVPICEAHGWFEEDKNGAKRYYYPSIGFNRLTIRDNAEVFDSLFQLYSKGSLPVEVIYELFNLNSDEMHSKLLEGLFTAKDSTFNRATEEVNVEAGRALVQQSDIVERMAKYLGLKYIPPPEQEGGGEMPGGEGEMVEGEQAEGGQEGTPEGNQAVEEGGQETAPEGQEAAPEGQEGASDVESVAQSVVESLPPDASDEDIDKAIEDSAKEK